MRFDEVHGESDAVQPPASYPSPPKVGEPKAKEAENQRKTEIKPARAIGVGKYSEDGSTDDTKFCDEASSRLSAGEQEVRRTNTFTLTTTRGQDVELRSRALTMIIKAPTGRTLKRPVALTELQAERLRRMERGLADYILEGCGLHFPSLLLLILENESMTALAKYLYRYRSKSPGSLSTYCYCVRKFSSWLGKTPDQLIFEVRDLGGAVNPKALADLNRILEDFAGYLRDQAAPSYVNIIVTAVKTLCSVNGIAVTLPFRLPRRVVFKDRAPNPEELQRLIDVADLREKVIVSMLALGGFREGTLRALRYGHVKVDLERGIVPAHVHVEAKITKGKYADYDTFLGQEAVGYLKAYLDLRRRGDPCGKIPPETITNESPLIRGGNGSLGGPISGKSVYRIVHNLYLKTGLLEGAGKRRHPLCAHSIRKFFRTQLTALGVPSDYIEYMMGHKMSTYLDIQMKGVEFLRNVYAASGLSIKSKTRVSRIEMLKEIIRGWGMKPEKILTKEVLSAPCRAYVSPMDREEDHVKALSQALKEMLRKELLAPRAM